MYAWIWVSPVPKLGLASCRLLATQNVVSKRLGVRRCAGALSLCPSLMQSPGPCRGFGSITLAGTIDRFSQELLLRLM